MYHRVHAIGREAMVDHRAQAADAQRQQVLQARADHVERQPEDQQHDADKDRQGCIFVRQYAVNAHAAQMLAALAAHNAEALVNDAPLPVVQQAEDETAVRRVRKGLLRGENAACQRGAAGPGQAENADGAGRAPCCDGSDDIRHDVILSKNAALRALP